MSNVEQRIIVGSLAYIVFDLMGKKVKEMKESELMVMLVQSGMKAQPHWIVMLMLLYIL